MKPKIPVYIADAIEDALNAARMESASFSFSAAEDAKIKAAVANYLRSWVIGPLEVALHAAYGDPETIRTARERVAKGYNDRDPEFRGWLKARDLAVVVPADWPVQPLKPGDPAKVRARCGACHREWDDGISTSMTPAPAARCPFEPFHEIIL